MIRLRALYRLVDLGLVDSKTNDSIRLHRLIIAFIHKKRDLAAQFAVEDALFKVCQSIE